MDWLSALYCAWEPSEDRKALRWTNKSQMTANVCWVRPQRACYLLDCGITHLYDLIAKREITSFLDGRSRKITVESINRYIATQLALGEKRAAVPEPRRRGRPPQNRGTVVNTTEHYVPTAAIRRAVDGRELEVLVSLGIPWIKQAGHINCTHANRTNNNPSWRWDAEVPRSKVVGIKQLHNAPLDRDHKHLCVGEFATAVFETIDRDDFRHAHRIYLSRDDAEKAELGLTPKGEKRDPKKSARKLRNDNTNGRGVICGDPTKASTHIICEGVETAAAVPYAFRAEEF